MGIEPLVGLQQQLARMNLLPLGHPGLHDCKLSPLNVDLEDVYPLMPKHLHDGLQAAGSQVELLTHRVMREAAVSDRTDLRGCHGDPMGTWEGHRQYRIVVPQKNLDPMEVGR
eukprot:CAMPEP_0174288522 /NCGR_PEP_ID=MMETSP0809-20121228/21095_1 /TAXON_ID=73025 ORGANISM="Eutreptiella gymnastica-like, Strain CCMP1594" /NCGR_SAMPLE_ID=MMETSP0809 /ASSEMBLY_ACC=CAM_ASM_000658 /LENGTH=112 /DNA_ID=CAMNT_0015385797 /DNA_START=422 /DNA_END=760 /DNA_ORIENTATION=+